MRSIFVYYPPSKITHRQQCVNTCLRTKNIHKSCFYTHTHTHTKRAWLVSIKTLLISISELYYRILPSSGLLRGVRWLETDVSGLRLGPIFNDQNALLLGQFDPWRWDWLLVPKRLFLTTSCRAIIQSNRGGSLPSRELYYGFLLTLTD